MTAPPKAVPPIPECYHCVTPWIISREAAKLLDFLYIPCSDVVYQQALAVGATAVTEMKRRSATESRAEVSR